MDLISLEWRKASRSADNGGNCVEVAAFSDVIALRDSKEPEGPQLRVSRGDFRRFAAVIKRS